MVLTACDNYVSTYSSSQTEGQKILKCFEEKDKKTLKSIFSEKMRKRKELDSEIDEALNFIDGKIVSYDPDTFGGDGDAIDEGFDVAFFTTNSTILFGHNHRYISHPILELCQHLPTIFFVFNHAFV